MFINDIADQIDIGFRLNADVLKRVDKVTDCGRNALNLSRIVQRCTINNLSLNVSKCQARSFFTHTCTPLSNYNVKILLHRTNTFTDLCIHLQICFSSLIPYDISKSFKQLGFIRFCGDFYLVNFVILQLR